MLVSVQGINPSTKGHSFFGDQEAEDIILASTRAGNPNNSSFWADYTKASAAELAGSSRLGDRHPVIHQPIVAGLPPSTTNMPVYSEKWTSGDV